MTARARRAADREQRISSVVDAYLNLVTATPLKYQGISALLVAGVKRLEAHDEVAEALQRIAERAGRNPLGQPADSVSDLHAMLQEVRFDGVNVTGYDAARSKYQK